MPAAAAALLCALLVSHVVSHVISPWWLPAAEKICSTSRLFHRVRQHRAEWRGWGTIGGSTVGGGTVGGGTIGGGTIGGDMIGGGEGGGGGGRGGKVALASDKLALSFV